MTKQKCIVLFISVFILMSIVTIISETVKKAEGYLTYQDLIEDYIQLMASGSEEEALSILNSNYRLSYNIINAETGVDLLKINPNREEKGLIKNISSKKKVKKEHVRILKEQQEFIESKFGKGAWEKVSYVIEEAGCPEKIEKFVDSYKAIRVIFSFNGMDRVEDLSKFRITLIKKGKYWKLYQGLIVNRDIAEPDDI